VKYLESLLLQSNFSLGGWMAFPLFRNAQFLLDKVSRIHSTLIFTEVLGTTLIIPLSMLEAFWDL
jgi:hypothetical protein